MIIKLKRRLITVAMLSSLLVLTLIMGTVNYLNYLKIIDDADRILDILEENSGMFPRNDPSMDKLPMPKDLSPETPYESRYFSVLIDKDTQMIISTDVGMIAAIDKEAAIEYANEILASAKETGFVDSYRFRVSSDDNYLRIVFLDCSRNINTFKTFMIASVTISILGLGAVFVLILILSKRMIKPIITSYQKQKEFITNAGHELKTPLTIINADIDILKDQLNENEWLLDIHQQSQRLNKLTTDLIYLARMEEEKPLNIIEFPLSDLITETANAFQVVAKQQNKRLISNIQPMISIKADQASINQLLNILIDNAIKYSIEDSDINIHLTKTNKIITLVVENATDLSIDDNPENLFERFYRSDHSRNTKIKGYGLGLSIAKAIVEAHKGKILINKMPNNILQIKVVFTV